VIEPLRGHEWLYTVLSGDATITSLVGSRIYDGISPQGVIFPYIIYSFLGGADTRGVGTVRVFNSGLYQVKAVCEGESYAPAAAIADRIDELIHGNRGSVSDGSVVDCVREQPLTLIEQQNGVQYRHVGGLYRIIVQEA